MKQSLQLGLSQHLALTPQLQQSIRLLQLSTVELNQELDALLQTNPMLERDGYGEGAREEYSPETSHEPPVPAEANSSPVEYDEDTLRESYPEFSGGSRWEDSASGNDDDDADYVFQEADSPTLREHLLSQTMLMPLSNRDQTLVSLLIDAISEDGYLEQSLEELATLLPEDQEVDLLEMNTALKHIQHFDPPGVGARNLAECLSLQLRALPADTPRLDLAVDLVEHHLPALAARDYAKLRKLLRCDEETLRETHHLVTQLNPRPGMHFTRISSDQYIQYEIVVRKVKGVWIASLHQEAIPKLRINQLYADILKRNRESSNQYLMSQMQEAKWMIKNIQQRFSTILRVSQAIVDRQRNFFEHGEIAMRPLVLREIADEVGLHESTISRVTTRKYMLTPRGVYELKHFFGSHVATDSGGACSATAIRALIKQLVGEENQKKPLSDSQIADILGKQGIVVARRTIAKYRESLQIPPASQRKSL
jgi:RNA polymerase sigma-54 factor